MGKTESTENYAELLPPLSTEEFGNIACIGYGCGMQVHFYPSGQHQNYWYIGIVRGNGVIHTKRPVRNEDALFAAREMCPEFETIAFRCVLSSPYASSPWESSACLQPPETAIYFITAPRVRMVKIGLAANVHARFRQLATASPVELSLVGHIRGGARKERELHERFESFRERGEWFRLEGELDDYISDTFGDNPNEQVQDSIS